MDPLHQNTNKQLPQAPMPGGFAAQQGYNPPLNPNVDPAYQQQNPMHQQQGGIQQGGLNQGGYPQDGYPQGAYPQGGGLNQGGLHQGGLPPPQAGFHPQGGLHHGNNLNQENFRQNEINQADVHQHGLHAHNPRNTDIGLSHDQQLGTHHNYEGTQAPLAHHTHQGAANLPSSTNYHNNGELSEPSSNTATHGSVDSRKDYENASATRGIKDTLAGNLQKIAGVVTGNDERRVRGEARAQEGKIQLDAAKAQQADRNTGTMGTMGTHGGHGRGDLEGTHAHDIKALDQAAGTGTYAVDAVPPTGHGRGGLENREVGNDSVFANANTGKATGIGYGRGGLEGMASREE